MGERTNKYTMDDEYFLKTNYKKQGAKFCSEYLGRTLRSVIKKAHMMEISRKNFKKTLKSKRYEDFSVNPELFFSITNPAVIYCLGFIWGDGYVLSNTTQNRLSFTIVKEDFDEIIPIFNSFGRWNVRFYQPPGNRRVVGIGEISNKPIVDFLMKHNYHAKSFKSACSILEVIPENLRYLWFRGLFDADGGIYFNPSGQHIKVNISSGYEQDWTYMEKIFKTIELTHYRINRRISKNGNKSSNVEITKRSEIINFLDYIYSNRENDLFGLTRKYEKYQKCLVRDQVIKCARKERSKNISIYDENHNFIESTESLRKTASKYQITRDALINHISKQTKLNGLYFKFTE